MDRDKFSILEELLDDCFQTRKEIENELQNNLNRLEELTINLQSMNESEETDIKYFSPRSVDTVYMNKISELKGEKDAIEKENQNQNKKLEKLDKQIENLKLLLKKKNDNNHAKHLKILDVQEKERSRIARELHDSSLQNLTHLVHMLELSSMFIDQDPIRAKLELASCSQNLKQTINEIRDTIFNLRPMSFDDLGFKQCIENYFDNLKQQFKNCEMLVDVDDITIPVEDNEKKEEYNLLLVTIYRVIQEALINSLKHADPSQLKLCIRDKKNKYFIQIDDNGHGFILDDVLKNKDKHFGLSIMKERVYLLNGTIEINSSINEGTHIEIVVPKP